MIIRLHLSSPIPNPNINPNPNPRKRAPSLQNLSPTINQAQILTLTDSGLRFRHKLLYLHNLHIDTTKALDLNPNLRSASLHSIIAIEKCLYSMGIQRSEIGRIINMQPQLLTFDSHTHLYPIFDFLLNEVRIPFPDIRKSINRCPRLLICSVRDRLRPTLYFLRRLGFVGHHQITCQTTLLLVSSVERTLLPKMDYLMSLGFSYKEVVNMVLRSPGLFTFSIENNFRPKVEYFLKDMKGDLAELSDFPQYFSFSLNGKIKPRHQMLVEHGFVIPLRDMLKVSDGEFSDRLVEMQLQTVDEKFELF